MTFALDLQAFAEKAGKRADQVVHNTVWQIAANIDYLSPVGDATYWKHPPPPGYVGGHFRANWQIGVDSVPGGEVAGIDRSAKDFQRGGATTARIAAAIPDEAGGHVYYIANNAPYAMRLETGWSGQSPQGMVGITALKFEQIIREEVERLP